MPMKMSKINSLISKAEGAVLPLSAAATVARKPLQVFASGGVRGLVDLGKQTVMTWHPPTLTTLQNFFDEEFIGAIASVGVGAVGKWAVDFIPFEDAQSPLKRLLGAVAKGGAGVLVGKLGEALIFPTEYNPTYSTPSSRNPTGQLRQQDMRPGAAGWTRAQVDPKRAKYAKPEHPVRPR